MELLLTRALPRSAYSRLAEVPRSVAPGGYALAAAHLRRQCHPQHRKIHSNNFPGARRHASSTFAVTDVQPEMATDKSSATAAAAAAASTLSSKTALSCLPLSVLLRSYIITVISSTPFLLTPSLNLLAFLANSKSPILDPDRNVLIRAIIKYTVYKQFCAGTNPTEVRATLAQLKDMGLDGAILGYAREVVMDESEVDAMNKQSLTEAQLSKEKEEVSAWELGTLRTIELAEPGDFVALKFTGAGARSLFNLTKNAPPSPVLEDAIIKICEKARDAGVRLLFDAEQAALQDGIDMWTVDFMQRYNKPGNAEGGRALVYGTYQAYRISTPGTIANHMEKAKQGGWRLGVKLVRGAYLGSDPRQLFWPSKEATDKAYNSIAKSLMEQKFGEILTAAEGSDGVCPRVDVVLAGHNSESVNKAMAVRDEQTRRGEEKIEMSYGQLMGMADHVSCTLIQKARIVKESSEPESAVGDAPQTFKYIVWGTVGECMKYLLRRAHENRDAVERTIEGRQALGRELRRRM